MPTTHGIHGSAFIHPSAQVFGRVLIDDEASVWPNAVIRSEIHEVRIGRGSNIQDFVMIHVGFEHPTVIGRYSSISHHATIHGATIGDCTLVGINATIMDGAVIGNNCIVAGHCIVPEGMQIGDDSVVAGVPAKCIERRDCSVANMKNAHFYIANAANYKRDIYRLEDWDPSDA